MKSENIEEILNRLGTEDVPAEVQRLAEQTSEKFIKTLKPSRQHILWSSIMKNKIAKLAAAAVIIVAVVLSVTVLDELVKPAYAIEQTVEAFRNVRFMHMVKCDRAGQIKDERWVEIAPDGFQARYRQDTPSRSFFVVDDRETVMAYYKDKNTIVLYDPNDQSWTWHYAPGKLFEKLANDKLTVTVEENVDYWGRKAHLVRYHNEDYYIDSETKLPIAIGGYEISYENPPEGTFDVVIPDGVAVIDKRAGAELVEEPEWMRNKHVAQQKFDEARKASVAGEYEKAVELFEKVVEIQPGRNWAWFWMGCARYELGEYDLAIWEFSKVIDMFRPHGWDATYCHFARGLAYVKKGMEDAAKQDFEVALPVMVDALRHIKAAVLFDLADDPLRCADGFLEEGCHEGPSKKQSRAMMINRLRIVTGQNFGYDPNANAEENEEAIATWEKWHKESGEIKITFDAELVSVPKASKRIAK